jgi:hypothetical protein
LGGELRIILAERIGTTTFGSGPGSTLSGHTGNQVGATVSVTDD